MGLNLMSLDRASLWGKLIIVLKKWIVLLWEMSCNGPPLCFLDHLQRKPLFCFVCFFSNKVNYNLALCQVALMRLQLKWLWVTDTQHDEVIFWFQGYCQHIVTPGTPRRLVITASDILFFIPQTSILLNGGEMWPRRMFDPPFTKHSWEINTNAWLQYSGAGPVRPLPPTLLTAVPWPWVEHLIGLSGIIQLLKYCSIRYSIVVVDILQYILQRWTVWI